MGHWLADLCDFLYQFSLRLSQDGVLALKFLFMAAIVLKTNTIIPDVYFALS